MSARLSRAARMDGLLCGESRSGPDSLKLGWHGLRKERHVIGCAVPWGPNPRGHTCQPGSRRSEAVLADRIGRRNRRRSRRAMEGALERGSTPSLTRRRAEAVLALSPSVGVKSHKPEDGSATEGVRGRVTTLVPVENAGNKVRCSEGSRSRAHRPEQAKLPGRPGTIVHPLLKLEARRQAKLHSITLSAKVSAGWTAWKPLSPAKADGGGDSRAGRSGECSFRRSVADAG